ncbi:MAG: ABC transporter ATP-binding protein [Firmicutes bacterium]|nr:ABC transporter ATP-binding protein [Bacillota bacterium]
MAGLDAPSNSVIMKLAGVAREYVLGDIVVKALKNTNLDIFNGELAVILGPSGSGKSTLLNIMGGMDTPSRGRILFNGRDIGSYNETELTNFRRQEVGFVFQFYNLIPNLTALENVELAGELSDTALDSMEVLCKVGLGERADHFPTQLSGGEQQRVAIARAVVKNPEILLCDEPTGALDQEMGKLVLALLADINRELGKTVVIITHNSAIGGMGNRVIKMRDGEVAEIIVNSEPLPPERIEW